MLQDIIFFVTALISDTIGTIVGFGSSSTLLPVALIFFNFHVALALVAFSHLFGNIGRISVFIKHINVRLFLLFAIPSAIFSFLGAASVTFVTQSVFELLLGLLLLIFSITSLTNSKLKLPGKNIVAIAGGTLSGLSTGLIGEGGVLRGAFLTSFNLKKEKYIATAAAIAISSDLIRIPVYLYNDFLPAEFVWFLPLLLFLAVIGAILGKIIVKHIKQDVFNKVVLVSIGLLSLKLIYDSLYLFF